MSANRVDGVPRIAGKCRMVHPHLLGRAASTHRLLTAEFHKDCP